MQSLQDCADTFAKPFAIRGKSRVCFRLGMSMRQKKLLQSFFKALRLGHVASDNAVLVCQLCIAWSFLLIGQAALAQKPASEDGQAPDPIRWASNHVNLARMSASLGDTNDAERLFREVLALPMEKLGAEHPTRLSAQADLSNLLFVTRRFKEAEQELRTAIQLQQRVLGAEHSETLRTRYRRTVLLSESGKHAEEESELRAILQIQDRKLGRDHADTLRSREALSLSLSSQRNFKDAESESRYVLQARELLLGPEHADTIEARNTFATALYGQEKYREAEQEYRSVLQGRERTVGPDHRHTLRALFNLAVCLRARYNEKNTLSYSPPTEAHLIEAREYARRAFAGAKKVLGPNHASTQSYREFYLSLLPKE